MRNIIIPRITYKITISIYDTKSAVINNNLLKSPRSYIAIQISHGRNLLAIWTRALRTFCQPCHKVWSTIYNITEVRRRNSFRQYIHRALSSHKLLSAFVTVTTGETSRAVRCCGRADRMETTNTYVILCGKSREEQQ
jgi:hypothetical protein